jgi:hypothetical protein
VGDYGQVGPWDDRLERIRKDLSLEAEGSHSECHSQGTGDKTKAAEEVFGQGRGPSYGPKKNGVIKVAPYRRDRSAIWENPDRILLESFLPQ